MISSELSYAARSLSETAISASNSGTIEQLLPDLTKVFIGVVRMTLAEMQHYAAMQACEEAIH